MRSWEGEMQIEPIEIAIGIAIEIEKQRSSLAEPAEKKPFLFFLGGQEIEIEDTENIWDLDTKNWTSTAYR